MPSCVRSVKLEPNEIIKSPFLLLLLLFVFCFVFKANVVAIQEPFPHPARKYIHKRFAVKGTSPHRYGTGENTIFFCMIEKKKRLVISHGLSVAISAAG